MSNINTLDRNNESELLRTTIKLEKKLSPTFSRLQVSKGKFHLNPASQRIFYESIMSLLNC